MRGWNRGRLRAWANDHRDEGVLNISTSAIWVQVRDGIAARDERWPPLAPRQAGISTATISLVPQFENRRRPSCHRGDAPIPKPFSRTRVSDDDGSAMTRSFLYRSYGLAVARAGTHRSRIGEAGNVSVAPRLRAVGNPWTDGPTNGARSGRAGRPHPGERRFPIRPSSRAGAAHHRPSRGTRFQPRLPPSRSR
jgi:hypothetical protein